MSVIVIGMDTPQHCYDCSVCYDYMACSITESRMDWKKCDKERHKDCPLKSIDGLIEKITQLPTQENTEGQNMFQAYDVLRTIREYCEVSE